MTSLAARNLLQDCRLMQFAFRGCSRYLSQNLASTNRVGIRGYAAAAVSSATVPYGNDSRILDRGAIHHNPNVVNDPKNNTMPPGHPATVANLKTFVLPDSVTGTPSDVELAQQMIQSWREDGIFQITMNLAQQSAFDEAFPTSKAFFNLPLAEKARHVDSQSFAGYIASGEELTDGISDYSEIFTITKDLPESDYRVRARWPCHGPCPWPNSNYERVMKSLLDHLGDSGDKLLKLTALGLGLKSKDFFSDLTEDGWHHMRVLR